MSQRSRELASRILTLHLPLALFVVYVLFPFYWAINTSLKTEADVFPADRIMRYFPERLTLENYLAIFRNRDFVLFFTNSLFVSSVTCGLLILLSSLAGYAMARFRFRGKVAVLMLFFATQMFPGPLNIIPLYVIMSRLGLINNHASLILAYSTAQIPFCTILMRGFFVGVPVELEEAAMVDGCSRLGALFRVVLPIALPGIVAVGIFAFLGAWNELVLAVTLIDDVEKMTFPAGLMQFIGELEILWARMMAGAVIALVPALALFAYVQRYLVRGLAAGAVKG